MSRYLDVNGNPVAARQLAEHYGEGVRDAVRWADASLYWAKVAHGWAVAAGHYGRLALDEESREARDWRWSTGPSY